MGVPDAYFGVNSLHWPRIMTDQPPATDGFVLNQTMMRIKDPAPSLDFYQQVLGMTLSQRVDFAEMSFSL